MLDRTVRRILESTVHSDVLYNRFVNDMVRITEFKKGRDLGRHDRLKLLWMLFCKGASIERRRWAHSQNI